MTAGADSPSALSPLRALVVDDEALVCQSLVRKLAACAPSLAIEAVTDPCRAVDLLTASPPRIVLLDVEMPRLNGFEVLAHFPLAARTFDVIFCTAHAQHAVRAFRERAVDFLVKPVDDALLAEALARVLGRAEETPPTWTAAQADGALTPIRRLLVRTRKGQAVLDLGDVVWLASEAHRTVAYTEGAEYVLAPSLDELERCLDPDAFFRTHRAHVVAVARVREVDRTHEVVVLEDGRRVPLARRRRAALLERLAAPRPGR